MNQGNMTVAEYYTKLKQLWDELVVLMPLPTCTCGATKEMVEVTSFNHLMQFFIGLADVYEHNRNQILLMDPLPSMNKAYSMVSRVEMQKEVQISCAENNKNMAMYAKA